ncbi:hypothetical protein EYF80_059874 [Liparis tanakae]|uniref:Uncharacterized protein n=1 Tax=Liparis tanakae TaxID=230148 RepID=A0A4Z2EM55_9TELE|nr:hypothetical protein EYF80_059874 [Liparis tanakae]
MPPGANANAAGPNKERLDELKQVKEIQNRRGGDGVGGTPRSQGKCFRPLREAPALLPLPVPLLWLDVDKKAAARSDEEREMRTRGEKWGRRGGANNWQKLKLFIFFLLPRVPPVTPEA